MIKGKRVKQYADDYCSLIKDFGAVASLIFHMLVTFSFLFFALSHRRQICKTAQWKTLAKETLTSTSCGDGEQQWRVGEGQKEKPIVKRDYKKRAGGGGGAWECGVGGGARHSFISSASVGACFYGCGG